MVKTWFDTLAWIKANKDAAIEHHGEEAAASAPTEYKTYDAGTTIFTREQNLAAFTPGTTPGATSTSRPARSPSSWSSTRLVDTKPPLDGLFEPKFVKAVPE